MLSYVLSSHMYEEVNYKQNNAKDMIPAMK